jgi:hypothetical protein
MPASFDFQRPLAETSRARGVPLARTANQVTFPSVAGRTTLRFAADEDHTPSPQGQCASAPRVLPLFPQNRGGRGDRAAQMEPKGLVRVGFVKKSSKGTTACVSDISFSAPPYVAVLRPAVTMWANRSLAVASSAQGRQRSPVAQSPKVRRSVQRPTLLIASLTPENAPDLTSFSRGAMPRATRFSNPAQPRLRQVFCVHTKTQEDTPCSPKS